MEKIDKFIPKFRYNYSDRILLLLMFSASSILKSQNLGPIQGKQQHQADKMYASTFESTIFKKPNTNQSMATSQTLKGSIISDSEYNSSIYEWRKSETAPIIKVIQLASRSEIDYVTGMSLTHKTIRPQRIFSRLSNFQQFSKQQLLLILKNLIEGHQAIFKKMRATSVSLDKCIVTLQGEVKVWVNNHLERNDISGEVLTKQEDIVKRIFQLLCYLAQNNLNNHILAFISYVNSTMSKNGKWTFYALRAMIKSYVVSLRIKLPDRIKLQNLSLKSQIQDVNCQSLGQNLSENNKYRRNSLQIPQRNIKSSLIYSKLTKDSQTSYFEEKQGKQLKQKHQTGRQKNNIERVKSFSKFSTSNDDLIKESFTTIKQNQTGSRQHRKIPSINDVLLKKLGFTPLPQALPEDESSAASARKQGVQRPSFFITNQVNVCIQKQKDQGCKPQKVSSISTSNQTSISGTNFGFQRKVKGSEFIEQKENFARDQLKSVSRESVSTSFVPKSEDCKKAVGSCTNWPSSQQKVSDFSISNLLKKVHSPENNDQFPIRNIQYSDQKNQNPDQILSFKNISQAENNLSPIAKSRKLLELYKQNPMSLLNQLRSQQQLQSYQITSKHSTDSPSRSARSGRFPIEEKILELLGLNEPLRTSSYVDTNSEQKIKQISQTPARDKQKRLRHIQQTLSELMKANLRQEEIIEGNCWTKKLENLVGFDSQLKQSINFGMEQANALIRQLKLSKLGKCGRQIGHSLIPE